MKIAYVKSLLVALLFTLAACGGKDFVRPSPSAFQLGNTTYSQVIEQMGEPEGTGEVYKNGAQIKTISYVYASMGGAPSEEGAIPGRAQIYMFHEGTLVGREFISSFKSDSSNFEDAKVADLKEGETSRAEVIKLFGEPTGAYVYPMVSEAVGEAIGYAYQTVKGGTFTGLKSFIKVLRISFDKDGIVSDLEFTTSGTH